jgi:hypothetical protein
MDNDLLKTEFYFEIIINDYKLFLSTKKGKAYLSEIFFIFFNKK